MKSFMALSHNDGATINSNAQLLFLAKRRKIGIPDIGPALPLPVGLFFPNLDVFATIVNRLAARIVYCQFIRSTDKANVPGFRHFHLGRLPTDDEARPREQIVPDLPSRFLCRCRGSLRRLDG